MFSVLQGFKHVSFSLFFKVKWALVLKVKRDCSTQLTSMVLYHQKIAINLKKL